MKPIQETFKKHVCPNCIHEDGCKYAGYIQEVQKDNGWNKTFECGIFESKNRKDEEDVEA